MGSSKGELFLAVDGGGTKTAIAVAERLPSGRLQLRARAEGAGTNPYTDGFDAALAALSQIVSQFLKQHAIRLQELRGACFCLAGVDSSLEQQRIVAWLDSMQFAAPHLITNDAHLLLAAARPDDTRPAGPMDGIGLVAGTGSIALGQRDGRQERCGGWGYLIGDEGSATWLGRELLGIACRVADGRSDAHKVLARILQQIGVRSVRQLVPWVYAHENHPRLQLASLASLVFELQEVPEVAAMTRKGARELAEQVTCVARKLGFRGDDYVLALSGSVLVKQDRYRKSVLDFLAQNGVAPGESCVVEDPVLGALRLAAWQADPAGS